MSELLHWIAHLVCAFLGVVGLIFIDDLRRQLAREKQRGVTSDDVQVGDMSKVELSPRPKGKKPKHRAKVIALDAAKG